MVVIVFRARIRPDADSRPLSALSIMANSWRRCPAFAA